MRLLAMGVEAVSSFAAWVPPEPGVVCLCGFPEEVLLVEGSVVSLGLLLVVFFACDPCMLSRYRD